MQGIHLRKYGVEAKIPFVLYEIDGVDLRVDAADAGSDCSIMKDEGAEATCTNDFVDEGKGYSITLTLTEMQAARIVVYIVDSATKVWLDDALVIETYGNAAAQHAFDLDAVNRGTDGANTTVPDAAGVAPTAVEIQAEMEACSGTLTVQTADTVFNLTATLGTLSAQDDTYNNMVICIFDNSGGVYETARISDYDGTNTRITIDHTLTFPVQDGVDTWAIYRDAYSDVGAAEITALDKAALVDLIHDEDVKDAHQTAGSAGYFLRRSGQRY